MYDVIIVGGGPAGLSAALMLGRSRRHVLLCDSGLPRNAPSHALHGYLTRDGIEPSEFRRLAREELRRYDCVEIRDLEVADATCRPDARFHVRLATGEELVCRKLLIATGVLDNLPDIPGMRELYGRSVFHCPYCDGWEWRDRRLAVVGVARDGSGTALTLRTWSRDVALCTNGSAADRGTRERVERNGVAVRTERIARLVHDGGVLQAIEFAGASPLACDALFFTSGQHPQSDLAIRLGCQLTRRGTVKTGTLSDTNVPGVFVAGDASRDAQFAVVAAAEGIKAAVAINQALQQRELVS